MAYTQVYLAKLLFLIRTLLMVGTFLVKFITRIQEANLSGKDSHSFGFAHRWFNHLSKKTHRQLLKYFSLLDIGLSNDESVYEKIPISTSGRGLFT
jgi:hypothetical protein